MARWRPDFWSPSLEWVSRTQFIAVTETEWTYGTPGIWFRATAGQPQAYPGLVTSQEFHYGKLREAKEIRSL